MTGAAEYVPAGGDLAPLQAAAAGCRGCELYREATQTVFGRGTADARVVMVGEQPGDVEDQKGPPFVPAALLTAVAAAAGVRCVSWPLAG